MPISQEVFRKALGSFASGVTVVTVGDKDHHTGLTVTAFSSVSLEPPLILICIHQHSSAIDMIRSSKQFAVNFLAYNQQHISNQFAAKDTDKFLNIEYEFGQMGMPILRNAVATLECHVQEEILAGDHYIYIGKIEHALVDQTSEPLLYFRSKYQQVHGIMAQSPAENDTNE